MLQLCVVDSVMGEYTMIHRTTPESVASYLHEGKPWTSLMIPGILNLSFPFPL